MSSEFLASSWKKFRGHSILNHTPVLCGTVSWVKISWFVSQPRKPRKFYPPKNTRYTVYQSIRPHLLVHLHLLPSLPSLPSPPSLPPPLNPSSTPAKTTTVHHSAPPKCVAREHTATGTTPPAPVPAAHRPAPTLLS